MARPGERQNAVGDGVGRAIPFDEEQLLAPLDVSGKRAIGESELHRFGVTLPRCFINDVHDPRGAGPPHAHRARRDGDNFPGAERRRPRPSLAPTEIELRPSFDASPCSGENLATVSQGDARSIDGVARWEFTPRRCCTDPRIGEIEPALDVKKFEQRLLARFAKLRINHRACSKWNDNAGSASFDVHSARRRTLPGPTHSSLDSSKPS